MTETGCEKKWAEMLRAMLADHRRRVPEDTRSDQELLVSLMEHFYNEGVIGKNADGKYLIGPIDGAVGEAPLGAWLAMNDAMKEVAGGH